MTELIEEIGENIFKLSLGDNDEESKLKIHDVSGKFEEFDIFLAIKNENDVESLKKIFHAEGGSVKKLAWKYWSDYEISTADVIEMLNCFDKLEVLELSSFDVKFKGEYCGKIHLPNIKSLKISYCDDFIIDFLTNVLPENSIPDFTLNNVKDVEDKLNEFIKKQTAIKKLTLYDHFKSIEPFKLLNLESLSCFFDEENNELEQQREFLHSLIKSQINLKALELNDSDHMFGFVNDAIFTDIFALSFLENLSINIEKITPKGIEAIANLTTLKTIKIKATKEKSALKTFKKLSCIKNASLENLHLEFWFDIPAEFYELIGKSYENLKSLIITRGIQHSFTLIAKEFANLEKLKINFGDVSRPVEFQQVFNVNDSIKLSKLKFLVVGLSDQAEIDMWLKFLSIFPNLEKLEIDSTLSFTAEFIYKLANNLKSIKSLKLLRFVIKNKETFPTEILDALKYLRLRLNYVSLLLTNTQKKFKRNSEHEHISHKDFTFKPLIDELRNIYKLKESHFIHVCKYNNLILEAGTCETWSDED